MPRTTELKRPRGRPPSLKTAQQSGSVQVLDRALALLDVIADEDGLTLSDVAQRAGLAPSTAHRILATLQAHDYAVLDEERGLWRIGVKAFEVGSAFLRSRKVVTMGRTEMRALMERCGETVNLAIEDDGEVVFVSQVESHDPIRAFFRPGTRGAIHASGIGKALLATLADGDVRAILHKRGLKKFTDRTLVDPAALFTELEAIRDRGWAVDDEERTRGMRCVAAPIYNEFGEAIAGVSVSGPAVRMDDNRLGELGPLVKRTADRISRSIGGRLPATGEHASP